MTDEEHAKAVIAACEALNKRISDAVYAGLLVDIHVRDCAVAPDAEPLPVLTAKIRRPL